MSTAIERQSLQRVMANLNQEIAGVERRTMKGFLEGAMIVRADMEKTPPLTPVDKGNLRQSWYTSPMYKGTRPILFLGFSADYALPVHEKYGAHFQRPGAGAGFFVASINRNKENILEAIRKNAKVKR